MASRVVGRGTGVGHADPGLLPEELGWICGQEEPSAFFQQERDVIRFSFSDSAASTLGAEEGPF